MDRIGGQGRQRRQLAASSSSKINTDTHDPIPPPTSITTGHEPAATPPVGRSRQGTGSTDPAQPVESKKVKEGEHGMWWRGGRVATAMVGLRRPQWPCSQFQH